MDAELRVLADETGRRILRLASEGERISGGKAKRFVMRWPAMSQHLGVALDAVSLPFDTRVRAGFTWPSISPSPACATRKPATLRAQCRGGKRRRGR